MPAYQYIVQYQKRILSGLLEGFLLDCSVKFPDWHSADAFRAWAESNAEKRDCMTKDKFAVESVALSAISNKQQIEG